MLEDVGERVLFYRPGSELDDGPGRGNGSWASIRLVGESACGERARGRSIETDLAATGPEAIPEPASACRTGASLGFGLARRSKGPRSERTRSPAGRAAEHATLRNLDGPPRQVQRLVRRGPPRRALLTSSLTSVRRGPMKSTRAVSIARSGFVAVTRRVRPEPPSQPTTGNIVHPEFGKLCLVLPGGPNVGDHQPTARTQHPHRFADGFLPAGTSR